MDCDRGEKEKREKHCLHTRRRSTDIVAFKQLFFLLDNNRTILLDIHAALLNWYTACDYVCTVEYNLYLHFGFYSSRHGDTPASMQKMAVGLDTYMATVHFCLHDFHHQRPSPLFNPGGDEKGLSDR